jgi:hypothetical protein
MRIRRITYVLTSTVSMRMKSTTNVKLCDGSSIKNGKTGKTLAPTPSDSSHIKFTTWPRPRLKRVTG